MRFRKLRIAWSIVLGVLGVMLIVLWVRSYRTQDVLHIQRPRKCYIHSTCGVFTSTFFPSFHDNAELEWSSRDPNVPEHTWWFRYCPSGIYSWYVITIPHWFVILISTIAAAIPWLSRRFSLRTLLITITLVALALSLTTWAARN